MSLVLKVCCYGRDEKVIINPDEDDIVKSISMLQGLETDYVILGKSEDDMTYMQADGVNLEHQEGSLDYHYYCPSGFISVDNATGAFISYARGDDFWKNMLEWEKGFTPV